MEPDEILVARFLEEGDESAFETLVRRYEAPLRKVAFGYLRDTMLAEDVAQEAFLQAYQRLDTLGRAEAFRSWLYRIAINRAHDHLRRMARKKELAGEEGEERIRQLEDPVRLPQRLEDRDFGRRLAGTLAQLPEKYRRPLMLKEIEGMTYAEIAELLGWPMGTVQIRIHRARLRLRERARQLLEEGGSDEDQE
ncbi:MAG: sigma-70 family RNA polymerase sigma factor [Thermoanaerobaculia bacterium]|nr:sigma-70 family RNA polymerase sigma factor [Thermoanaerobaculia bacterium]